MEYISFRLKMKLLTLWTTVLLISGCSSLLQAPKNDDEIRLMLAGMLKNYDVKLRPNYLGKPIEVTVDATVLSISNIDEV